ncbi:MAG: lysophospholipid acyltransferase family protein, partial [Thermodesulfobacteriota bacterium]
LLRAVAFYYTLFRPSIGKKADPYLKRRFRGENILKKRLNRLRIYVNFGKSLVDKAVIGIKGPQEIQVAFDDQETILELVRGGKGLLILTAHVGCWQAAMSALHFLEKPVSLLLHREAGDVDLQYFEHKNGPPPFRIIDPLGYLGGVLEMMEVLKKGEVLCIMGDRVLGDEKNTVSVNFLGEEVRLPVSAFKLAGATGVPIPVLFSYKSGPDAYRLFLDRVIRVPKDIGKRVQDFQPQAEQFAGALEAYVEKFPYQFFNFYDLWGEGAENIER